MKYPTTYIALICSLILLLPTIVFSQESELFPDLNAYFGGADYDISEPAPLQPLLRAKKKIKNTLGTYSGTFALTKSRSFNGANCTPTQSFAALISVNGTKKKPTGQIGNIPVAYSGRANKKGSKLKGSYSSGGINRKYTLLFRKVKSTTAKITLTEIVKSGTIKACLFKHSAVFSRTQ